MPCRVRASHLTDLNGAFGCLIEDFQIQGITPPAPDQPRLFNVS